MLHRDYEFEKGQVPDSRKMQLEACRIILASGVLSGDFRGLHPSQLRDLITANPMTLEAAQFIPVRAAAEGRLRGLEIRGRATLFEECPLEAQLRDYVPTAQAREFSAILDVGLPEKACRIVMRTGRAYRFHHRITLPAG